ncbi:MAG: DUF11 domain-containing protein, partial [Actinomycetia bacterium]|nr:DUF11 domain-containing protein [Actinomycetes bacterium]
GTVADSSVASGTPKPSTKDPHPRPLDSNPSDYQDPVDQNPALTAVKSPDQTTKHNVGDVITYTFMVTNTGNVTLGEVNVTDTQVAPAGALDGPISCPAGMVVLAPGRSITCTATYTVTQADVNNGSVADTAVAHGTPPIPAGSTTPPPPIDSAEASATVNIPSAPGLSVVKTASPSSYDAVGQTITYAFEVTNTGNVTENDITVTDSSFTGTGKLSAVTCPQPSLSAGESETCTATYTTTQADLDAGRISNSATVSGSPPPPPGTNTPPAEVVSPPSEVIEPAHARPGIAVVKTASTQTFVAGTTITYTFAVTNTGNVTLHNVTVTDVKFSGTGNLSAVTCPKGTTLPPGWRLTCAATYVATAADVAAGKLTNAATAAGVPPADGTGVTAKAVSSQEAVVLIDTHGSGTGTLINTGLGADAPANSGGVGLTLAGVLLGLLGAVCLLVIAGRGGRKEP